MAIYKTKEELLAVLNVEGKRFTVQLLIFLEEQADTSVV